MGRRAFHFVRWLPALVWMGFIFYWSSQSVLPIDGYDYSTLLHRISHFGAYSILALLLVIGTGSSVRGLLAAFIIASLYGVTDEIHQSFVPGRSGRLEEVVLNTVSAAVAVVMVHVVILNRRRLPFGNLLPR
ncbi:MAG TPA: VanZ family protein [Chloroflexota bacterium]|nr:VanZ family protein [Chloroflexota bacterium]